MRLADCFTVGRLAEHLRSWRPYPPIADRGYWGRVPRETREYLLAQAAPVSQRPWPLLTAAAYARFNADGDRQAYERPYFTRRDKLIAAVLTALLTGDTSAAEITDGVWLLCEETTWCVPAHQPGAGLPAPAGHQQAAGRAHRATGVGAALTATAAELALDLAAAYPGAAGVRFWHRTLRLDRTAALISIHDRWELSHISERSVCYLITQEEPQVDGATITLPSGLAVSIDATVDDATAGDISVERRDLNDPRLKTIWGEHLYRITLALPGQRGSLNTLIKRSGADPRD